MYDTKLYQKKLKQLGFYHDVIDGVFGPNTKQAVLDFQKSVGIEVDGIIGPETWSKLFPETQSEDVYDLPWMTEGMKLKGYNEVRNKIELWNWLRSDGSSVGDPSKIPWCGDFVETCLHKGLPQEVFPKELRNPYWAQNWKYFGKLVKPQYGAVLVFVRRGGGHVGFYIGEDKRYYHVLGGNQSNSVTVSKVAKSRCVAVRWPNTYPESNQVVNINDNNKTTITTNEV